MSSFVFLLSTSHTGEHTVRLHPVAHVQSQ